MKFELVGEFLLTYSWGLLILGIVVSSMAAFGYLDMSSISTDKCLSNEPFECVSIDVFNTSQLDVVVKNKGNDTEIYSFNFKNLNPPCGGISNASINNDLLPQIIPKKDIARIRVQCTTLWAKNDLLSGTLIVSFRNLSGSFNSSIDFESPVRG